jgi:hypothetical protein
MRRAPRFSGVQSRQVDEGSVPVAVALLIELDGMTETMYAELCERVELRDDPPDGLIFHAAGPAPGGWRFIDVWDTQDHWDTYFAETVRPALAAIAAERGYDPVVGSRVSEWDVLDYATGPGPLVNSASL